MTSTNKINCDDLIFNLNKEIDSVLGPFLSSGAKCALVDFPNHSNSGDSAIWLGETTWLRKNENEIVYLCDLNTYSRERLAAEIGNGIILLHGGGNLGDLWTDHQQFREQVIRDFPNNKIIQLPQSIFFHDNANLERCRQIFNNHSDLTLLCRDYQSLEFARKEFTAQSFLCPDMAFTLGRIERPCNPETEIVWLARTDKESLEKLEPISELGIERTDWLDEPPTSVLSENQHLTNQINLYPHEWKSTKKALYHTYDSLAHQRLLRGCRILSKGKVVISNRLHAHILCLLMEIPHVLLNNNYGKIKNFYDTWTKDCEITKWANSAEDAVDNLLNDTQFTLILKREGTDLEALDELITRLRKTKHLTEEDSKSEKRGLNLWLDQLKQIEEEIFSSIPERHNFILVDDNQIRNELNIGNRSAIPFLERNGQFWGAAPDDETAIREMERLRLEGATFIVFAKPSFWWLIYYNQLHWYLRSKYTCLVENDYLVVFAL